MKTTSTNTKETGSEQVGELDALFVLGGGLIYDPEKGFQPTGYEDGDQFGMLGGRMRVVAAAALSRVVRVDSIYFSTGITEKNKEALGPDVPTEALVYRKSFEEELRKIIPVVPAKKTLPAPTLHEEDKSNTTLTNLTEMLEIVTANPELGRIGVLTSGYHVPRVKALFEEGARKLDLSGKDFRFMSAEGVVREVMPGVYDAEIEQAYQSPIAQERDRNEQNGLRDLRMGKYAVQEFQLSGGRSKSN